MLGRSRNRDTMFQTGAFSATSARPHRCSRASQGFGGGTAGVPSGRDACDRYRGGHCLRSVASRGFGRQYRA